MNFDTTGVHASHCCIVHGCKYNDQDCPVVEDRVRQNYLCEECPPDLTAAENDVKAAEQALERAKEMVKFVALIKP